MKQKVKEMEEEANKLREMQAKLEEDHVKGQEDVDSRSIYIGNVNTFLLSRHPFCGTVYLIIDISELIYRLIMEPLLKS